MPTLTETNRNMEGLISENNGDFARSEITLISGQNLRALTVLGRISASGKYTILNTAGADGSQNAAAILLYATDASGGDKKTAAIVGGPGISVEFVDSLLVFPNGISGPNRAAAITALLALGIKTR